ncbi:patatin [Lunatibacter salilacus]|uniref:patatin n=1 Tax=Lunatibacter salilacus TaxID=2483804 RepID=UPI00131B50D0|nr:patatin [Lunatibacter salilacus]
METTKKGPFWKRHLQLLVVLISIVTVVLGIFQLLNPQAALGMMGKGEILPVTAHYFSMLGFFMILFNGMVLHTVYEIQTSKTIILWAALQKVGVAVLVFIGIIGGHFHFTAIGVALFDLFSGVIFLSYFAQLNKASSHPNPLQTNVSPTDIV